MAKMCDVCGKKPISGNNISHAHNKTGGAGCQTCRTPAPVWVEE